jgi:hypothetical protein
MESEIKTKMRKQRQNILLSNLDIDNNINMRELDRAAIPKKRKPRQKLEKIVHYVHFQSNPPVDKVGDILKKLLHMQPQPQQPLLPSF